VRRAMWLDQFAAPPPTLNAKLAELAEKTNLALRALRAGLAEKTNLALRALRALRSTYVTAG